MTPQPYVLPGLPGEKTLADNLDQGALFASTDGKTYSFRGLLPDGRWTLYSLGKDPAALMMPDKDTGFPAYPTQDQVLAAMVAQDLWHVSSPLDDGVRNLARQRELTKREVLEIDPYAKVRMSVCRLFDREQPALDDDSLDDWLDDRFDWDRIRRDYGRGRPPASTARSWFRKRGKRNQRYWSDMMDCRGQGERRKRVTGERLAIAVWHAISHWTSRRHPSITKLWRDVEADTKAYNDGKEMIMHPGERRWAKPDEPIRPADREFFRQLVKKMEGRHSYASRWSAGAAQQRWLGGGKALETSRFLEVVQQDETEAPGFFFIDAINRIPLGAATWVIAVCIHTGCCLSWDLSFDTPSKISWMRNVLNASRYKALPKEYAERFPQLATIGGRMSSIIYDNPAHIIGHAVEDAHGDVVQDVILAGEGQPTHKAVVERTHDILRMLFTAELPGAKMQIALAREFNMDPSKETLLTLQEGRLAMARAVCRLHTEIKDEFGRTRLDRWMEEFNRHGPQHAKDQEQFERAIADVTLDRVLDNGGVVYEHVEYSDRELTPDLMEAHAQTSHLRRRTRKPAFDCKVKPNPTDMSHISVFDPRAKRYVRLPAKKRRYTAGLTLAIHKLVMRHRGAQSLMASPDGEDRLLELRRLAELEVKRISDKMAKAEQRARAAIMQQPVIRDLMGVDIGLIEVAPTVNGMGVQHDLGFDRRDMMETPVRSRRGSGANALNSSRSEADEVVMPMPDALLEPAPSGDEAVIAATDDNLDADPMAATPGDDDDDDDIVGGFQPY